MCDTGCPCIRLQPFVFRTSVRRKTNVASEVEPEQLDVLSALGSAGVDGFVANGAPDASMSLVAERFVHACGALCTRWHRTAHSQP